MPTELPTLTEQLLQLRLVYEDAVLNKPIADIKNISSQIQVIEKQMKERKQSI